MSDILLEQKIKQLENDIRVWAEARDLWTDSSFSSYLEYFDDEPNLDTACVTVLHSDGGMFNLYNGYVDGDLLIEFELFIENLGYFCEPYNHYIFQFFTRTEELNQLFLSYFEWKWISEIIKPDYTSLYQEIYGYFSKHPEKFYQLSPRKFEILVSEIFRNQGYRTELGKGQSDNGVDIKIFQKNDIDQIATLVQVKKWKPDLPVKLEAVAALTGCVYTENASAGIFVTTSRYLPVAKKFAGRENSKLTLADSSDVRQWCQQIQSRIIGDKSTLFNTDFLLNIIKNRNNIDLVGKVVVASVGYGMTRNDFCIIIRDSPQVSLLMRLPSAYYYNDAPYNSIGEEIPLLNETIISYKTKENVFRAKKSHSNDSLSFYANKHTYYLWDQNPVYFNWND